MDPLIVHQKRKETDYPIEEQINFRHKFKALGLKGTISMILHLNTIFNFIKEKSIGSNLIWQRYKIS
jgi:hypothetical protein